MVSIFKRVALLVFASVGLINGATPTASQVELKNYDDYNLELLVKSSDALRFAHSGSKIANSDDLNGITFRYGGGEYHPKSATIDDQNLTHLIYDLDGVTAVDSSMQLVLSADTLNSDDGNNSEITINSSDFLDKAHPIWMKTEIIRSDPFSSGNLKSGELFILQFSETLKEASIEVVESNISDQLSDQNLTFTLQNSNKELVVRLNEKDGKTQELNISKPIFLKLSDVNDSLDNSGDFSVVLVDLEGEPVRPDFLLSQPLSHPDTPPDPTPPQSSTPSSSSSSSTTTYTPPSSTSSTVTTTTTETVEDTKPKDDNVFETDEFKITKEIKDFGDYTVLNIMFYDKIQDKTIKKEIKSFIKDIDLSNSTDGKVDLSTVVNDTETSLEIKTTLNPDGTAKASLNITKNSGINIDVKIDVNIVDANTTIQEDGSIKVDANIATKDDTRIVSEIVAKRDGTVDSNIKIVDNGKEVVTKIVANIPDSDVNIKKDGTVEVTTPAIDLQNKRIAIITVAKPTGEVKPIITIENNETLNRVELPKFNAGSQVEVKQTNSGKLVIDTKTAPMSKDEEMVF